MLCLEKCARLKMRQLKILDKVFFGRSVIAPAAAIIAKTISPNPTSYWRGLWSPSHKKILVYLKSQEKHVFFCPIFIIIIIIILTFFRGGGGRPRLTFLYDMYFRQNFLPVISKPFIFRRNEWSMHYFLANKAPSHAGFR